MLLRELFFAAQKQIPGITPYDFMHVLYSPTAGFAPVKEANAEVDDGSDDESALAPVAGDDEDSELPTGLNTILYGPPGTGKTFTTIDEAIKILDPEFYAKNESERESLKERFDMPGRTFSMPILAVEIIPHLTGFMIFPCLNLKNPPYGTGKRRR